MAVNLDERACESCQQEFDVDEIILVTAEVFLDGDSWVSGWGLCPDCYKDFSHEASYLACYKLDSGTPLDKDRCAQHGYYRK